MQLAERIWRNGAAFRQVFGPGSSNEGACIDIPTANILSLRNEGAGHVWLAAVFAGGEVFEVRIRFDKDIRRSGNECAG